MKGKNTESAQKSRENESDREVVDFLSSDWYAEQCEIYLPHIKSNKAKSRLDILKSFKLISKKLRRGKRSRCQPRFKMATFVFHFLYWKGSVILKNHKTR